MVKRSTSETAVGEPIVSIDRYLAKSIEQIKQAVEKMPKERKRGWDDLNNLFLSII